MPVQRFSGESIGPSLGPGPPPFDLCRFRQGPSGLSFHRHQQVSPHWHSSHRVVLLLEAYKPSVNRSPMRTGLHLSWGSIPFSARQKQASVSPGESNLRHRPSSRFLTALTSCSARNHASLVSCRLRSWGSTGPRTLAPTFRPRQGVCARVSSSRLSPHSRRARVGVLSSFAPRGGTSNDR
jgi:hypothetical protein